MRRLPLRRQAASTKTPCVAERRPWLRCSSTEIQF